MKSKYKIIDNFLPKEEFKEIKNLLFSDRFNWFYSHTGVSSTSAKDSFYFAHLFYEFTTEINYSRHYNYVIPIIKRLDLNCIKRIKANLYTKTDVIFEHDSHFDFKFKHKGFLYYVNTNNGFTKLSDGTKIQSIENRGLFFDSYLPHNSSTCTDDNVRININFNYF